MQSFNPVYNPATGQWFFGSKIEGKSELYYNAVDRINDTNILTQIILNRFEWNGESLNLYQKNNYIERLLFAYGQVALYKNENYGNIIIPCFPQGINPFGEPASYLCQSFGGVITEEKLATDIVVMRDNVHCDVPITLVLRYAQKTSDVQRTEEVYARRLKTPNIIAVSANRKETAKMLQQQILDNKECIVLERNGDITEEVVMPVTLQTGLKSEDLLRMVDYRRSRFNEILNYFGIRGDSEIKAAQMNRDEIENNETISKLQLDSSLLQRNRAVEEANERFGFDLKVDICKALKPVILEENNLNEDKEK